jgi:hypothetical protein
MYAFCRLTLVFSNLQLVLNMNALDNEHSILRLLDFSTNLACQSTVGFNFARLQRAPEGSEQSTGNRGDQIIDGGGMGLAEVLRSNSVVLGNSSMHTEDDWFGLAGKLGITNWPPFSFNVRFRYVRNLSHSSSCSYIDNTPLMRFPIG